MRNALICAALFVTMPAYAQGTITYDSCIATAQTQPASGLSVADQWYASGGGDAARHCRVIALASLGSFGEAARLVEEIAEGTADAAGKSDLYAQAGDFRMAQGDAAAARMAFGRALALEPSSLEALDGRARAAAAQRDFPAAIADLNNLLWAVPNDSEALALRAAARRQSGDVVGALQDSEAAVAADFQSAVAFFERGAAKAINGDHAGARADWLEAERLDPQGETGQLAANNRIRLP